MPYRPSPAVALLCPQSGERRAFQSANALRRAMVSEGFSCQGLWHGHRWCLRETDWIAWDLHQDAPLDLGPLFDQNKGRPVRGHARRQVPVPGVSRARSRPAWLAGLVRPKGVKALWDRKDRYALVEGEPQVRRTGLNPPSRYDDNFNRRPERSWKRHRAHQWKPI